MSIKKIIRNYSNTPLPHRFVSEVLANYNRPNDKISELIRSGFLISLRRGLYVPGPESDLPIPHLFLVANHLRGPSYISLESALSHWEMIPERVYEIHSITLKTSHVYRTPIGRFSYRHLVAPYYSFGLQRVQVDSDQFVLIASPEKALCDKIITTSGVTLRSRLQTLDFLTQDMRLDQNVLSNLDVNAIESWVEDAPKSSSLQMLVNTLRSL